MSNLTGATSLANTIRTLLAQTKAQLDKAGNDLTVAVGELQSTATEASKQVRIVQTETADLRAALGLGSNGGEAIDDDPIVSVRGPPLPLPEFTTTSNTVKLTDVVPPPPFNGPALPPRPYDDKGSVHQIKLDGTTT